ncbi:MAG: rhodanese-like domain-containing protein [Candidatus Omnitrophota bacterium]|nr:rhodanese-like domain-containing protein [Candidatus Omnitrophota bacterium]
MNKSIFVIIIAFLLLFSGCSQAKQIGTKPQEKSYSDITINELIRKIEQNGDFVLLDVRTPAEYVQGYIKGAVLISHTEIETRYKELGSPCCTEIVVYCRSGRRSVIAGNWLVKSGFRQVKNLLGGIKAWKQAGGEVVKEE